MGEQLAALAGIVAQIMRNFMLLDNLIATLPDEYREQLRARIVEARDEWQIVQDHIRDRAWSEAYTATLRLANMYQDTYAWYQDTVTQIAEETRRRVNEALERAGTVAQAALDPFGILDMLEDWHKEVRDFVEGMKPSDGPGLGTLLGIGALGALGLVVAISRR